MANKIINAILDVNNEQVSVMRINNIDYISLTDIAKYKNSENPANVIIHWLSNRSTFDYIGLWEELNNPDFNFTGFREIKNNEVGYQSFTLSPSRWIKSTNAIGIVAKGGKYSIGTFAHPDIAFEFASWISSEFKLYLIKEFERLKANESYQNKIEWSVRRLLSKTNYRVHTDSIQRNLILPYLTKQQTTYTYANEADVLNVALFGMTAKEWREQNPRLKGNIRDSADIRQLIVLTNLENINSLFLDKGINQRDRLVELNKVAIGQLKLLESDNGVLQLEHLEKNA
jgi:hypothetical protein